MSMSSTCIELQLGCLENYSYDWYFYVLEISTLDIWLGVLTYNDLIDFKYLRKSALGTSSNTIIACSRESRGQGIVDVMQN